MLQIDCAICAHRERPLIERFLSKGEPIRYLEERFPGLNDSVIRHHRDVHMSPIVSTEFASPQNILWDLQESRVKMQGLLDFATKEGKEKPHLAIHAVKTLITILAAMDIQVEKVRTIDAHKDAELLQQLLLEEFVDDPKILQRIESAVQRRMITEEQ